MHVHQVRRRDELIIPDFLQQHGSRQQLIATLHHILQQPKLPRQQIDRAVAAFGGTLNQVELQRPYTQRRLARFGRPAQQGLQPGDKLDECERFREVVVTAHSQSAHAIIDGAQGTQHQHGSADLVLPQCFDHREPIHSRQQSIHDHGVGLR